MDIFGIITAFLSGGLAGAGINIYFQKRRSAQEYRSLILAFALELVLAFERCVIYYEQSKKGEISYSGLFDFTDASILSKFAAVSKNPETVAAIVDLKSVYFQVGRHVEEASKFAAQANRLAEGEQEKTRLMRAALHAQGTALAFFNSSYEKAEKQTAQVIEAAKKISPGDVVKDLFNRFSQASQKKRNLDKQ